MKVHLVDYGTGNVHNVLRALDKVGAEVDHCTTPEALKDVAALVIPGVGAFGDCVGRLRERGFERPLLEYIDAGGPVLGICVGMQMLADTGEEFGRHAGLGVIPGVVRKIPSSGPDEVPLKRTHIGWRQLADPSSWDDTPLVGVHPGDHFYFVHSYAFECTFPEHRLATCRYGGLDVTAAVRRDNVFGVQFHPEKSGPAGLELLRCFLEFAASRA